MGAHKLRQPSSIIKYCAQQGMSIPVADGEVQPQVGNLER